MNYLDLFSGIGGFHLGLIEAGYKFDWTGHSEIDKYANEIYKKHFPTSEDLGDVRTIELSRLPRIDIISFGFPCQDLSIAGKGAGLHGERSGLFFEAMRIIKATRPKIFIFENVKGLLTKTKPWFASILKEVADLRLYESEWQLLNTRWFLPQNRERLFFIGTLGAGSCRQVFPIGESDELFKASRREGKVEDQYATAVTQNLKRGVHSGGETLIQTGVIGKDSEATRVYSPEGCARTIKNGGGMGAKTGLYEVGNLYPSGGENGNVYDPDGISPTIKSGETQNKKHGGIGSCNAPKIEVSPMQWIRTEKGKQARRENQAKGIDTTPFSDGHRELVVSDKEEIGAITSQAVNKDSLITVHNLQRRNASRPSLTKICDCGSGKLYKKCHGVDGGTGPLSRSDGVTYCLDSQSQGVEMKVANTVNCDGYLESGKRKRVDGKAVLTSQAERRIRRLTPKECERLQGFPDDFTDGLSDTQRYKCIGNAVSIPVVKAIGGKLLCSKK